MKIKSTSITLKRLSVLEQRKSPDRPFALFPEFVDFNTWESMAVPMQARLKQSVRDGDGAWDYSGLQTPKLVPHIEL